MNGEQKNGERANGERANDIERSVCLVKHKAASFPALLPPEHTPEAEGRRLE